jgi:hypothetical protein
MSSFFKVSITLTSDIKVDNSVRHDGVMEANPHSQQAVLERAIRLIYKKLLFEREYCNINVVIDSHEKRDG